MLHCQKWNWSSWWACKKKITASCYGSPLFHVTVQPYWAKSFGSLESKSGERGWSSTWAFWRSSLPCTSWLLHTIPLETCGGWQLPGSFIHSTDGCTFSTMSLGLLFKKPFCPSVFCWRAILFSHFICRGGHGCPFHSRPRLECRTHSILHDTCKTTYTHEYLLMSVHSYVRSGNVFLGLQEGVKYWFHLTGLICMRGGKCRVHVFSVDVCVFFVLFCGGALL